MRLTIQDWGEFEELHKVAFPGPPPGPSEAIVVVEKKDGKIVAFGCVRVYTVLESFWVAPDERGHGLLTKLCRGVLDVLPRMAECFAFTQDERTTRLFEHFGMEQLKDWRILRWVRR